MFKEQTDRERQLDRAALEHAQTVDALEPFELLGFTVLLKRGPRGEVDVCLESKIDHTRMQTTTQPQTEKKNEHRDQGRQAKYRMPILQAVALSRAIAHELDRRLIPGFEKA